MKEKFKRFILRLMLSLTGYAREKRQLVTAKLRVGEIPSNISLSIWDHQHDGRKKVEISVYYRLGPCPGHDYFDYKSVEEALGEFVMLESFVGKEVF